jgi:signal peptidase I
VAAVGSWHLPKILAVLALAAIPLACCTRAFVVEAFKIPAGSMIPTLLVGDHIFISKSAYGSSIPFTHTRFWSRAPKRGEVVVFAFPEHPEQDFIKRVVALPGDALIAQGGHPVLNGWRVPSCRVGAWSYEDLDSPEAHHDGDLYVEFLGDESYLTFYDRFVGAFPEDQGPWVVQDGEYWVMGDNRNNSHDSRMWYQGRGGGVPFDHSRGRALSVWLSMGGDGIVWSRQGLAIHKPTLPDSAASLQGALDACLKQRPAQTLPPPRTN